MSNIRIELNHDGIEALLKSAELERGLEEIASGIAGRCGDGYASDTKQMATRCIASVYTADEDAMLDNEQNNTILRCLK